MTRGAKGGGGAVLRACESAEELRVAATLFREYAESLPFSLEYQGFDAELASLPGAYGRPRGCIVLAWDDVDGVAVAVGCAALRPLGVDVCEVKRMYVRGSYRGRGVGRALAEFLIGAARGAGYGRMRLDSSRDFAPALGLYRSLGFEYIERYNDDVMPDTVFMELDLANVR